MRLTDLLEQGDWPDDIVIRFDGVDYEINDVYVDRGVLVLETTRFNEDDGTGVMEDDIS